MGYTHTTAYESEIPTIIKIANDHKIAYKLVKADIDIGDGYECSIQLLRLRNKLYIEFFHNDTDCDGHSVWSSREVHMQNLSICKRYPVVCNVQRKRGDPYYMIYICTSLAEHNANAMLRVN